MSHIFQIVNPDDIYDVWWDFNDSTGAANAGTTKTAFGLGGSFSLLAPEAESTIFSGTQAGGTVTH